jgi:hypothetical protein
LPSGSPLSLFYSICSLLSLPSVSWMSFLLCLFSPICLFLSIFLLCLFPSVSFHPSPL